MSINCTFQVNGAPCTYNGPETTVGDAFEAVTGQSTEGWMTRRVDGGTVQACSWDSMAQGGAVYACVPRGAKGAEGTLCLSINGTSSNILASRRSVADAMRSLGHSPEGFVFRCVSNGETSEIGRDTLCSDLEGKTVVAVPMGAKGAQHFCGS